MMARLICLPLFVLFYLIPGIGTGANNPPKVLFDLSPGIQQVIVVEASGDKLYKAQLTAWERSSSGWFQKFDPMEAVIGRSGFAPIGEKKEGDGRTPSGIFALIQAFGYAQFVSTGLAYRQAEDDDFWVDDPDSNQYNRWVKGEPQANSFEILRRNDDLYKIVIVIEYNTQPVVPGKGSAIFLHIWKRSNQPTAGCVAVSEKDIQQLLGWLKLSHKPMILLGEHSKF